MSHFFDNRVNIYPGDSIRESINPPVISKEDINYENDPSYMKREIKKKLSKRATVLGIIFGLIIGFAVMAVCVIMHRTAIKNELAEEIARYESTAIMRSKTNTKVAYFAQTGNSHDVLVDLLDDGDCTTPTVCPCCDTVLVAAKEHTPEADDGNCLTERLCTECGKVAVEAHIEHTPEADDGDCTTPIKCENCDTVITKAKTHVDDGDCTTESTCQNDGCNHIIPPENTEHTPEEDDHNCLTALKCLHCSYVFIEANAAHTATDDNDCTTAVICSSCNTIVTEAKEHIDDGDCTTSAKCQRNGCEITVAALSLAHLPEEDDGDCTTDILCQICSTVAISGRTEHISHDDGDCTTEVICSLCNTVTIPASAAHTPEADDGDCTTKVCCLICDTTIIPASSSHTPEADDGDCTTAILCSACNTVTTPAYEAHIPMADDNDCTTEVVCSICQSITTPANAKHTPEADDAYLTTDILCKNCDAIVIPAPIDKSGYTRAILYILAIGIAAAIAIILIFKLIGAINGAVRASKYEKNKKTYDSYNFKHFENVRNNLLENRKNLICESAASVSSERQGVATQECKGRIFLTEQALEFYDLDLASAYKNFVIPLNSIQLTESGTDVRNNKVTLHTNYGKFFFVVPDAAAGIWKKQIDTACELKRFNATSK